MLGRPPIDSRVTWLFPSTDVFPAILAARLATGAEKFISPEPTSGCWLWTGAIDESGYGRYTYQTSHAAHRMVYSLVRGGVPPGLHLDHKCRVRCCVNPDHLEPVTSPENNRRQLARLEFAQRRASVEALTQSAEPAIRSIRAETNAQRPDDQTAPHTDPWAYGDAEIDPAARRLVWKGRHVPLTIHEFLLTAYLIAAERDVACEELYREVYGRWPGGHRAEQVRANVRSTIRRIRRKFQEVDENFSQIEVYAGFGYRWNGEAA